MISGVEQQSVVAQSFGNLCRLRRRLGGQLADRFLALRELVGEEAGERIVEQIGARGDGEQEAREEREHAERERRSSIAIGAKRFASEGIATQFLVDFTFAPLIRPPDQVRGRAAFLRIARRETAEGKARLAPVPGLTRGSRKRRRGEGSAPRQPPHLPVLTLKLPQDIGLRQSEIRSMDPGR